MPHPGELVDVVAACRVQVIEYTFTLLLTYAPEGCKAAIEARSFAGAL